MNTARARAFVTLGEAMSELEERGCVLLAQRLRAAVMELGKTSPIGKVITIDWRNNRATVQVDSAPLGPLLHSTVYADKVGS